MFAPITVFHVEEGKKYRFRVINAGINVCPFMFQVEDHNFTIIATEVSYVKPAVVNTLYLMSGERFDFVIDTNKHQRRDYFIRFKQLNPCYQKLQGFAVLRYHKKGSKGLKYNVEFNNKTIPTFEQEYPNGTVSHNQSFSGDESFKVSVITTI
jgi:FtsP/CotA-like multicopper oxidase with cupredoxin domain